MTDRRDRVVSMLDEALRERHIDGVMYGLRVAFLYVRGGKVPDAKVLRQIREHHDEFANEIRGDLLMARPGMRQAIARYRRIRKSR